MKRSELNVDTGKFINELIERRGISMATLASRVDRNRTTVAAYTKNSSIQTGILLKLCHALKYNFFKDIAAHLPEEFEHSVPADNSLLDQKEEIISQKSELIEQLQEQIKALTIENNIMKKALKIE